MTQNRYESLNLDHLRNTGDQLADSVVKQIYAEGELEAVNRLMVSLIRNDQMIPDDLPEPAKNFLHETSKLPSWANPDLIKKGEELFLRYMTIPTVLLPCASLPECYSLKNGVQVLWMTQQLNHHVHRRLLETAYLVIETMTVGGLSPGGRGIRAIQRVRLLHAAIRYLILTPPSENPEAPQSFADVLAQSSWKPEFGIPINQEDMAFTLMTFSYVPMRGLRQMVDTLSQREMEAYIHTWNVAGYLMGVQEDLLPSNFQEAKQLYETVQASQRGQCHEGVTMAHSLISFLESMIPGWLFFLKSLPSTITWELIGPETGTALGLKKPTLVARFVVALLSGINKFFDLFKERIYRKSPSVRVAGDWLSYRILKELSKLPRGGNRKLFVLPDHLAVAWKLK